MQRGVAGAGEKEGLPCSREEEGCRACSVGIWRLTISVEKKRFHVNQ